MFWPAPVFDFEKVDTEKRSHDVLAQDVGKQHSAFVSFWRKFVIKEDVLYHITIPVLC